MFGNWWARQQVPKEVYEYSPLPGPSWTRLVTLHPAQDGPPSVGIKLVDLSDPNHEPYMGISYAWEGQVCTKEIECNGKWLYITPTLFSCFLRLRDTNKNLILWVDALSIDQRQTPDALEERAAQVRAMSKIFSRATEVIAWLGEISRWDQKVFEELQTFQETTGEDWPDRIHSEDQTSGDGSLQATYRQFQAHATQDAFHRRVLELIGRPYFRRLWVRQEVAFARDIHFLIGCNYVQLSMFEVAIPRVLKHARHFGDTVLSSKVVKQRTESEEYGSFNALPVHVSRYDAGVNASHSLNSNFQFVQQLVDTRSNYLSSIRDTCNLTPQTKFSDIFLQLDSSLLATDTRDHVYALLSLCNDKHNPRLSIDYNSSQKQLASRVAMYLIEEGHCDRLLMECAQAATTNQYGWRLFWEWGSTSTFWARVKQAGFHCCPDTKVSVQIKEEDKEPARISLKGEIVGAVISICSIECPSPAPFERDLSMGGLLQQMKEIFNHGRWFKHVVKWIHEHKQESDDPEEFERRCWITLFADIIKEDSEVRRLSKFERPTDQVAFEKLIEASRSVDAYLKGNHEHSDETPSKGHWTDSTAVIKGFCNSAYQQAQGYKLALAYGAHTRPCLVSGSTQVDDLVCIIYGIPLPLVLRHVEDHKGTFILVGSCYIDGLMDGELFKAREVDPDNKAVVLDFALWPGEGPDDY